MLRALDRLHALGLALGALELEDDLLRRLSLLVEHRFRLAAEAGLLLVVAALALRCLGRLPRLVLRDLVRCVSSALSAVGVPGLRDIHLQVRRNICCMHICIYIYIYI